MNAVAATLLTLSLAVPLLVLAGCLWRPVRRCLPDWLWLLPLPGLVAAVLAAGTVVTFPAPFRLTLALDGPGAILLGAAAVLWMAAGLYARAFLATDPDRERFCVWWLATLTGSLGVFIVADVASFYLAYSLVSLAAFGLVTHAGGPSERAGERATGAIYVAYAIVGEALLLAAFVLLASAAPDGSLSIAAGVAALPASPWGGLTLALLVAGFGMKIGMVPLHAWMPLTYRAAPFPAAAVLSGAAVKAGIIGLIRFLPHESAWPVLGGAMLLLGFASAFYGVAIGLTQRNPKTVLAYSSISQMGLLTAVFGAGLAVGAADVPMRVALYGAMHVLVKGALFLGLGVLALAGAARPRWMLVVMALLALSLGGLPLSGGALAKMAIKPVLGYELAGLLAVVSAIGSSLLMGYFALLCWQGPDEPSTAPMQAGAQRPALPGMMTAGWLAIAAASVVLIWALYPLATGSSVAVALSPAELWKAAWPVVLGAALAMALWRGGWPLPRVAAGDLPLQLGPMLRRLGGAASDLAERVDETARLWPVAGIMLLALAMALAVSMVA